MWKWVARHAASAAAATASPAGKGRSAALRVIGGRNMNTRFEPVRSGGAEPVPHGAAPGTDRPEALSSRPALRVRPGDDHARRGCLSHPRPSTELAPDRLRSLRSCCSRLRSSVASCRSIALRRLSGRRMNSVQPLYGRRRVCARHLESRHLEWPQRLGTASKRCPCRDRRQERGGAHDAWPHRVAPPERLVGWRAEAAAGKARQSLNARLTNRG